MRVTLVNPPQTYFLDKKGDTEGLGVVLLEALASGTAVIGSNAGGIPDIIKDKETGLLTEPKNPEDIAKKIIYMLVHRKDRERFVKSGQMLIKKRFSWEVIRDEFFRAYNKISR